MRAIVTLALSTSLAALCQSQIAAAAGLPPPAPEAASTKCGTASPAISRGTPAEQSTNPACASERLDWRLSQHGPGFWTADAAAPAPTQVAGASRATVPSTPVSQAPADPPGCITYPLMVVISGEPRKATVAACPQPDGSWQLTQYTPGLPAQSFTVPAPPTAAAPPDDFGSRSSGPAWDWAAAPWFFGYAPSVVVVQGFSRFHRFGHPFVRGFNRGFAHSVSLPHGFTEGRGFAERHGFIAGPGSAAGPRRGFTAGAGLVARRR